jgi:dihydrofolate synthase / folylpolyglutamate synthase
MADHARSDDPLVQAQLDRFAQLSPGRDILGLERITALLDAVGNPHRALPPVFHVAGTNGKGSTCAFLRAAVEAAGLTAHVYTSPHLCRFNERIRVAGDLVTDAALAPLLAEVLDVAEAGDIGPSFFEATTAAAFLAFARTHADAAIIEVGLGGRLDATNVISNPAVCGIAQLGIDHQSFLGDDSITIAGEKAGIAKPGVPLITMAYGEDEAARVASISAAAGALWHPKGSDWDAVIYQDRLHYRDARGKLDTGLPRLPGTHQAMNAALATAMLRHQTAINIPDAALKAATGWASWPARLQLLDFGPVTASLAQGSRVWLDGAHNEAAGATLANYFETALQQGAPLHIVTGILANKDAAGLIKHFARRATALTAVPVPDHDCHAPDTLAEMGNALGVPSTATYSLADALAGITAPNVLIVGSLYLAGHVLRENGQMPN